MKFIKHTNTAANILAGIFIIVFFAACNNDPIFPKPRGYFRIDLPEKDFTTFDSTFPYQFEYPSYAHINFDKYTQHQAYWMNIDFQKYKGRIHISYKNLEQNTLYKLTEDARKMVFQHAQKANGIMESKIELPESNVFGMAYTIQGKDAASPFQFYLTDKENHFIRGALYFNTSPNNDSLKPVIDFIIEDIDHMVSTFRWQD